VKESLSTAVPTGHKELSLISLVPRWSGAELAIHLEEFLENIKSAAKLGRWHSSDFLRIAALKPADPARSFYNTCIEINAEDETWEKFKKAFRERFRDVRTDQFHFMRLQTVRQGKTEGPQESADRGRALARKIMCQEVILQHRKFIAQMPKGCFWLDL
jgi:hypothetical protein